jgi:hypothetical protein
MTATLLARLIDRAIPTFGNYQGIARAAGVSLSALMRAREQPQVFGVEKLIHLAVAIGERPDLVLRAGGKGEVADLLLEVWGTPAKPLNALDRRLLSAPLDRKKLFAGLVD